MIEGLPVISATEMQQIEKKAFEAGESDQGYMENAAKGIAIEVEHFLITPRGADEIYLLIGKGNKGGDAFATGALLLGKGFSVTAYTLFPLEECSNLCQKMGDRFKNKGGKIQSLSEPPSFPSHGLIIDGLLGTGFKGKTEGLLQKVIDAANKSGLPIFAIDIPSGVDGNTGKVESSAIKAYKTVTLGLPKIGFFLGQGWNHIGKLACVDFGMPLRFVEMASPQAYLISQKEAATFLPPIVRNRHKYQAGYVVAVAGSSEMSGAAIMSSFAALKAGAGIVRLFYPKGIEEELSSAPFELIKEGWDLKNTAPILEELKRAKAFLIGPGMGRKEEAQAAIGTLLTQIKLPYVIDADGLYYLSTHKEISLPPNGVLTPHHQEMERILGEKPTLANCQTYANSKKVTLVLKGAPTILFHPEKKPLIIPHGDPGMAKAGVGDVLTGMVAAMLAQGVTPYEGAALAVLLHSLCGELAAEKETSYCIVATDLLNFLPDAIKSLNKL